MLDVDKKGRVCWKKMEDFKVDDIVYKEFSHIHKMLSSDKHHRIGVISTGTHTIDYSNVAENISKIAYSGYCELIENDEKYVFRHADYKC